MRPPTGNRVTQGSHGATKAIDYSDEPDVYVYAPEDLTFDSYQQRGAGTLDAGMCLRGKGSNGLHQFGHLAESYFLGGTIKKGQRIAKMGYTGYTKPDNVPEGRHLHYWLRTPSGEYVYPPERYTEPFGGVPAPPSSTIGFKMPAVDSTIHLDKGQTRTVFHPGANNVAGYINVTDDGFNYIVRFVRNNRIGIYTKSGGSKHPTDYKELALYYTSGQVIPGWRAL